MVHKPKHKVHSFRGLLSDSDPGNQDEINLERQNVNLAYRIIKFQLMGEKPAGANQESIVQIFKTEQTSFSSQVYFTNPDLLAAGYLEAAADAKTEHQAQIVIFDQELFSQNIFISHVDDESGESCNYYIEIEEVPVGAATLMQLKLQVARKLNLQQD